MNWSSHSPNHWKITTFATLIKRAITICSSKKQLDAELTYLKNIFINTNQYPKNVLDNIIKKELDNEENILTVAQNNQVNKITTISMTLPYNGKTG